MSEFKQLSRSVKGLTVLVTGAASGMGRATARVFATEGANVAVTDYDEQGALAVAKEIAANGGVAKAWTRFDDCDSAQDFAVAFEREAGVQDQSLSLPEQMMAHVADGGILVAMLEIDPREPWSAFRNRMQALGILHIVTAGRSVPGNVAAIDDEIGARRADMLADAMEIVGQLGEARAAGKMRIGNLRQAKFSHCNIPSTCNRSSLTRRNGDARGGVP